MDSKRKISYQFKLFLPIVGMSLLMILGFALIVINREKSFKTNYINDRLDIITQRVVDLVEKNEDPTPYLTFIGENYSNPVFHDLSVCIYDTESCHLITSIGFPMPRPIELGDARGSLKAKELTRNLDSEMETNFEDAFYYTTRTTSDGSMLIQMLLPLNSKVEEEISGGSWWWLFIIISVVCMMAVTYVVTLHLAQNVKLLRDFASKAANDKEFVMLDKFANDELGEISRQIINIYNTRKAAIASRELEHRVALKATEDRSTMRRQMTNNINHELKTPASIIKGYIETIIDNPEMEDESKMHFIRKTHDHIEHLCNILNDLSTMTRLEEASSKIPLEEINFHDFIKDLATDIDESGVTGDMKFIYDIPADCRVKGNVTLLTAAIMNLVKNAVAYSKGTEMGIKLVTNNRRFYTFIFYDNGTGVSEEHIPMLFERFYRVDKGRSRKSGGTGLGLPIVRSSLNTIGGSIFVRNGESGGLEFVFTLSIWKGKGTPTPASES